MAKAKKIEYVNRYGKHIYITEKQLLQYQRQSKEFTARNKARRKKPRAKAAKKVRWQTRKGKYIYITEKQAKQYGKQSEMFTRLNIARQEEKEEQLSKLKKYSKGVYIGEYGEMILEKDITKAIKKDPNIYQRVVRKETANAIDAWNNFVDDLIDNIEMGIANLGTKNQRRLVKKHLQVVKTRIDSMDDDAKVAGGSYLMAFPDETRRIQRVVNRIVYESDEEIEEEIQETLTPILRVFEVAGDKVTGEQIKKMKEEINRGANTSA